MCGIIGVLANRSATPLLFDALRRLEYRGYDSAGVATLHDGVLERRRASGKLDALAARVAAEPLEGQVGIGHTRWATHGAPTEVNAHPHRAGPVAVVHNGIIENARTLRATLEAAGCVFESETDTEVVAHLAAQALARGLSPVDAVADVLKRIQGAFALCFLFEGAENLLIGARRGSPLAIGYGDGEMYFGSDALALASLTRRIAYLEEGDYAALTRTEAHVFDASGMPVKRQIHVLPEDSVTVDKAGRRHFMAKEIHEQPAVAACAVAEAFATNRTAAIDWARAPRVALIGCGTAHYACHVAQYWFEQAAGLAASVDIASEFRYRDPVLALGGVCIFVSQSGETADTLAALRLARSAGQTTVAVVNVEESSIAREADVVVPIHAGREIGVASTKAFVAQLIALAEIAVRAGDARARLDASALASRRAALERLPGLLADALAVEAGLAGLAVELAAHRDILFLGRGAMHPMALEGALKFKELTYLHAEGYAAGELKHGPIALIDAATPVVALAPYDALFDKTLSNLQEVMARNGRVALITDAAGADAAPPMWRTIIMPTADPFTAPMIVAIAVQLLAYHAAVTLGTDVDQPRNLAKSVTVE